MESFLSAPLINCFKIYWSTFQKPGEEALTNIVRHAQANMVEIKIVSTGEALELIIKDDGVGIDLGSLENFKSLGIIGMRERVSLIGGQLFISRDEKQGTIVTVRVLLNSNVEV
mgnify:CR=1 FL=1